MNFTGGESAFAIAAPGALQAEDRGGDDSAVLAESILQQMVPLLGQLKAMRARGQALEAILQGTLDRLAEATKGVAELCPEAEKSYQDRLAQRLVAAVGAEFDQQRLLEEVAVDDRSASLRNCRQ